MKIEPCPGCGCECRLFDEPMRHVGCSNCNYHAIGDIQHSDEELIKLHNEHCEFVRWGKAAKKVAENPPRLIVEEALSEDKTRLAHQYYSWAILDCIDRLKAAMEEK